MKYNLAIKAEAAAAVNYLAKLTGYEAICEVKRVNPKRTLRQNNYLYLLLGAFGAHFGYTLEEAKAVYKELNKDIYYYEKKGRTFIRSSAALDKEEMGMTIDLFRDKSEEQGCPLPLATDQGWLRAIENDMEQRSLKENLRR